MLALIRLAVEISLISEPIGLDLIVTGSGLGAFFGALLGACCRWPLERVTGPAITGATPLFFLLMTVVNVALLPLYLKLEARWERRSQAKRRGRSTADC